MSGNQDWLGTVADLLNEQEKQINRLEKTKRLLAATTWIPVEESLPPPCEEVLVWCDGHRGPAWRNNYALVAYLSESGKWWQERHRDAEPLTNVMHWAYISVPET